MASLTFYDSYNYQLIALPALITLVSVTVLLLSLWYIFRSIPGALSDKRFRPGDAECSNIVLIVAPLTCISLISIVYLYSEIRSSQHSTEEWYPIIRVNERDWEVVPTPEEKKYFSGADVAYPKWTTFSYRSSRYKRDRSICDEVSVVYSIHWTAPAVQLFLDNKQLLTVDVTSELAKSYQDAFEHAVAIYQEPTHLQVDAIWQESSRELFPELFPLLEVEYNDYRLGYPRP